QETVSIDGNSRHIEIHGRHDPVIVPRAVVVVESMAALVIADLILMNATARLDQIKRIYDC
ncbi:MAG: chorismate synthase, partial [Lachnospiraceae bacterium]|nr:chorismate synthase [Lachnospiraceae bacterium]